MNLVNIRDFDLMLNTHEIILEMIKAAESPYDEIILFGDSFGQINATKHDKITWNKNTIVIDSNDGNSFVVNHRDVSAFKVIR